MAKLDGSLGLGNQPVWFPSRRERRQPSPLSSKHQAKYPPVQPTPSPFGDFGRNGPSSEPATPSLSLAREPARAGLSRRRRMRVRRKPEPGPSCGAGPGRGIECEPAPEGQWARGLREA